jgi:AAA+ superfamily predicted ATPase
VAPDVHPAWEAFADAVLAREALCCRVGAGLAPRDLPGAFVAHEDVDRILGQLPGLDGPPVEALDELLAEVEPTVGARREAFHASLAGDEPFARIARRAELEEPAAEALAVLAALELHPDRQRLAVYVQDSVHHPRLTLGTLRRLFGDGVQAVAPGGTLRRARLVDVDVDGPWAMRRVAVPSRVTWGLLDVAAIDPALPVGATLVGRDDAAPGSPATPDPGADAHDRRLLLVTGGDRRSRLQRAAPRTTTLLVTPLPEDATAWDAVVREATVAGTTVVCEVTGDLPRLASRRIADASHLDWVVSSSREVAVESLPDVPWCELRVDDPEASDLEWQAALEVPRDGHRLNREQLSLVRRARDGVGGDLDAAIRRVASGHLDGLAMRVRPRRAWDDLVLPQDDKAQLAELVSRYRNRGQVFAGWGFRAARSGGVVALFAGASGTGKTLAAEVVAGELGLDLYRIDLSAVVSKYIGETEKNLERIFTAAGSGNLVLFFDEADALFGKRSEVSDAHDRYANIEVSYLLQRLEAYPGLLIMATNLQGNLDPAFVRRIDVAIDFPLPDEAARRAIWELGFPPRAPVDDLDLAFLSRQFKLSGGSIHNAALAAAFLAADGRGVITMTEVVMALKREFQKLGRLRTEAEFERYFSLVREHVEDVEHVEDGEDDDPVPADATGKA